LPGVIQLQPFVLPNDHPGNGQGHFDVNRTTLRVPASYVGSLFDYRSFTFIAFFSFGSSEVQPKLPNFGFCFLATASDQVWDRGWIFTKRSYL
jgi:hypothetical protein